MKREKKNNKGKLENRLKRKNNNLGQKFWINYSKISKRLLKKKDKECKIKMMSLMKTWSMIGSFVMTVAKLSTNKRLIINVKNVKTTCSARTVIILSFINILYIKLSFLSDSVPLSNQSVQRYCQNYNPVKLVDVVFHKLSNTFHMKTELRISSFYVIDAMIKVH